MQRDRKHPTRQFCKISFPGVSSPGKSYVFLQNFEKVFWKFLSHICSYSIFSSWKFMCFCTILRNPSWKIWSVLMVFFSSWKIVCVPAEFWESSPENFMCSSTFFLSWKIYMRRLVPFLVLLENPYVFLLHPSLLENLMCSRNLFKKVAPGKKEHIF